MMTADAMQALANATMEYKEEMSNHTRINLTLSQSLTQAQEAILLLFEQLQTLQAHMNSKKSVTEKPATENKNSLNKSKRYFWTRVRTHNIYHTSPTCNWKKELHQVGGSCRTGW